MKYYYRLFYAIVCLYRDLFPELPNKSAASSSMGVLMLLGCWLLVNLVIPLTKMPSLLDFWHKIHTWKIDFIFVCAFAVANYLAVNFNLKWQRVIAEFDQMTLEEQKIENKKTLGIAFVVLIVSQIFFFVVP